MANATFAPVKVLPQTLFLATGSNQGNSFDILQECNRLIHANIGEIQRESPMYITQAWGKTDQPDFLNQVLQVATPFTPLMVFQKLQQIEKQLGRVRYEKWGPRSIDIDILFYGSHIIQNQDPLIPHPELQNRNFVLKPLLDIAPRWTHPVLKKEIRILWKQRTDRLTVKQI